MQGGTASDIGKKICGVNFLAEVSFAGLTNYVIRYTSQYFYYFSGQASGWTQEAKLLGEGMN